jgi:hypothetical protein
MPNAENYYRNCIFAHVSNSADEEQEFVINKILEFYMYNLCIIPARGGSKGYLEKY